MGISCCGWRVMVMVGCWLMMTVVAAAAQDSDSLKTAGLLPDSTATLLELRNALASKGFDIGPFLARPEFSVTVEIAEKFAKSPEAEGIKRYTEASAGQDEKTKEALFDQEYIDYRKKAGYDGKVKAIRGFIDANRDSLVSSESAYGIPHEVIAAVIGIESNFGTVIGRYFAFNVYVSMYLAGHRKTFALNQLEELLRFSRDRKMDIFSIRSSYAGAMGYMQFIPASLNRWFVGDDLADMNDAIASVANYLAYFKKEKGSVEKAVFSYNPSALYTRTILDLAASVRGETDGAALFR